MYIRTLTLTALAGRRLQLLPKNCAALIADSVRKKRPQEKKKNEKGGGGGDADKSDEKPGNESRRKHREDFTRSVRARMRGGVRLAVLVEYCNMQYMYMYAYVVECTLVVGLPLLSR